MVCPYYYVLFPAYVHFYVSVSLQRIYILVVVVVIVIIIIIAGATTLLLISCCCVMSQMRQ